MQTTQVDMHDVTSINDIPEHMRPTFVPGVGYAGGIPFDRLPLAYHKFIPGSPRYSWKDDNEDIIECPSCHEYLQAKDMQGEQMIQASVLTQEIKTLE